MSAVPYRLLLSNSFFSLIVRLHSVKRSSKLLLLIGLVIIIIIAVVFVNWFSQPKSSLPLHKSNEIVREAILKEIPIGSSIDDALKTIKTKGMVDESPSRRNIERYGPCLMYGIYNNTWSDFFSNPTVTHQTNIYLIYKSNIIVDVQVERFTIGM